MREKQLELLIRQGEGYNLEFKESFSDNIGKDICAFANTNGGKLLVGISDGGEIKGVRITNKLKSQIPVVWSGAWRRKTLERRACQGIVFFLVCCRE